MVRIRKQSFWRRAGEKCQGTAVGLADRRQGHALCPVLCAQAAERLEGGGGSGKGTGWKQKRQGNSIKSVLLALLNTMENLTDGAREAALEVRAFAGLPKDLTAQFPHQVAHKCP